MSTINPYPLHFVSDLRRAFFCLTNRNYDGCRTFLDHAHSIYEKQLKDVSPPVCDGFIEHWTKIYGFELNVNDDMGLKKFGDKLLTLSSMIFLRSDL